MNKIINTLWLLFFIPNVHAQKPCSIITANAFYSIVMPGNMQVDEIGQPVQQKLNKNRSLFISTNCKTTPLVSKVMYDSVPSIFFIEKAKAEEVSNLMDYSNNKIKLKIATSGFLWKISIVESGSISIPEKPKKITILWKQKTKLYKLIVLNEKQLATVPMY
jgi:hypothetical protein